jgi:hypothetical protein
VAVAEADGPRLVLDGGTVDFVAGAGERLVEIGVAVPDRVRRARDAIEIGGVRVELRPDSARP